MPHDIHDKGYKYFLSNPKIFAEFARNFVKEEWALEIDENSLVPLNKSYIAGDFSEKEADIIYRAKIKDKEVIFYILLELQSTVDFTMPFRLLIYMTYIWMDILKSMPDEEKNRKDFSLPAIIPMVIYNGGNKWTAARRFRDLVEGEKYFGEYIPDFRYMLFDVNSYCEEELLEIKDIMAAVFLLDQKTGWVELLSRLKRLKFILQDRNPEEFRMFKGWLKHIFRERLPLEGANEIERILDESKEVNDMVLNITQTIDEMFKEVELRGIEKGIEKGFEKGFEKGIEKGIEKGRTVEKENIAEKLLKLGVDVSIIIQSTGLSGEEIEKIKAGLTN